MSHIRKSGPTPPRFPEAPAEYSQDHMQDLIRALELFIEQERNPGPVRAQTVFVSTADSNTAATPESPDLDPGSIKASRITLTDLPTSATGLETGALYNDSGTVKVA